MARKVEITRSRDNMGGNWFDLYDGEGDLHTSYRNYSEAQRAAESLSRETGATLDVSCYSEGHTRFLAVT